MSKSEGWIWTIGILIFILGIPTRVIWALLGGFVLLPVAFVILLFFL